MLTRQRMKLVTFEATGTQSAGVVVGDVVIDLATAFTWFERDSGRASDTAHMRDRYGAGILGFVEHAKEARPAADEIVRRFQAKRTPATFDGQPFSRPLGSVTLCSPLPRPPSMRDGYAFRQHVETARKNRGLEMIPEFDLFPVFYFTNHQAVIGSRRAARRFRCTWTASTSSSRRRSSSASAGRNLHASKDADAHIFGFTIMNDFSARALQMEEMKLSLGPAKGKRLRDGPRPLPGHPIDELAPQFARSGRRTGSTTNLEHARLRERRARLDGQREGHDLHVRADSRASELRR